MFDVVLYEPEIPPNTGNVIRLCANTGARLHLVHPMGFEWDDARVKRAGLDYHEFANVRHHADWAACLAALSGRRIFALSTKGTQRYDRVAYQRNDVFLFGPETRGLPVDVLQSFPEAQRLRLPMQANSRSLNLSNTVAVVVYEAWRQFDFATTWAHAGKTMSLNALLVDFNSYFASCEQQERPELRGRPVGVVPMLADTTCLIAASYEAKKFGVKTLTNVAEAKKLIPDIALVVARHEIYIHYHHKAVAAVDKVAPVRKVLSIDEMVCDLPAKCHTPEKARDVAMRIKEIIAQQVGEYLKVSIGIAPNTFLAKLASNMQKPEGLVVLEAHDVPEKILHLPLRALHGIGRNMDARLEHYGVTTIAQLYAKTSDQLRTIWGGVGGERFYAKLRGDEVEELETEMGSIGHSHVLAPLLRNKDDAYAVLNRLVQKAAMRLRKAEHYCGRMAIKVRFLNAPSWENETRFLETQDTLELLHALDALWQKYPKKSGLKLLQVAVTLLELSAGNAQSARLFEDGSEKKRLNAAIDALNIRYGKRAAYFGGAHRAIDHGKLAIAFNHIPDLDTEN